VQAARDEELSDDGMIEGDIDDMDFTAGRGPVELDDDEFVDANETAAEKRVRLARGYLDKVAKEVAEGACGSSCEAAGKGRVVLLTFRAH
jgi:ribosomal RNA-processing protein 9